MWQVHSKESQRDGEEMKYTYYVTRITEWEVEIEAENDEDAGIQFDELIVDDFGDPVSQEIKFHRI
jgi:hypothetical protein